MVSTYDLCLVLGTLFVVLSIPSLLNAWAVSRTPRFGAVLSIGGMILIVFAVTQQRYAAEDLPAVFLRVASRLFS